VSIASRLKALERHATRHCARPEDCPNKVVGAWIGEGDPEPDPADVAPCPNCGHRHVLVIIEEVVDPPEGLP
jgi:hypothetical protein